MNKEEGGEEDEEIQLFTFKYNRSLHVRKGADEAENFLKFVLRKL